MSAAQLGAAVMDTFLVGGLVGVLVLAWWYDRGFVGGDEE